MDLLRLYRTVRHLKPVQVTNRLRRRLTLRMPETGPAGAVRAPISALPQPIARHGGWDGDTQFELLQHRGLVACAADWNDGSQPKLWLYHLHYFEELARTDATEWRDRHAGLIRRWIDENPPTRGNGWEPYPIALRSVFWIKWALGGGHLDRAARDSLALQLRHLENNLEFHLLGNHLWADAKALYVGGLFFEGPEAEHWFARGLALLERERNEQILPDGGHFERSPAYHCLILEDVLDLIALSRSYGRPLEDRWEETARRMLGRLAVMTRPDGRIVAWNDAARNAVPTSAALAEYAARLGIEPPSRQAATQYLSATGYVRQEAGRFTLWLDAAPVGPNYIPGHAHADTLNIELSIGTRPLLVDTGTSTYDVGPTRAYERSTAAHNSVVVAGCDSSEVWGGFRVGRRARARPIEIGDSRLVASHDGYRHLGTVHRRTIEMDPRRVVVRDELAGRRIDGTAGFHLAPGIEPRLDGRTVTTSLAQLRFEGATAIRIEPCQIADGFNDLAPGSRIAVDFDGVLQTIIESR